MKNCHMCIVKCKFFTPNELAKWETEFNQYFDSFNEDPTKKDIKAIFMPQKG